MDTRLSGKVAVVTGAGRVGGIGEAIARALAAEGAKVVLSDIGRSFERFPDYQVAARSEIDTIRADLVKKGSEAEVVFADVSKEDDVATLVRRTVECFGRLDVMVNNAGIGLGLVPITELTVEAWRQNLDVMALGTMLGIRESARQMIRQGEGGAIVNVASQAGKTGWPLLGAYCAAKFAIVGLTQVAAKELGRHNITVNSVCPGTVETPLLDLRGGLWEAYTKLSGQSVEELKKSILPQIPLGRFQKPQDVADLVLFLASEQGRYITGSAINTTGGQEMH
ncbi:MAG: SDR family NAD(P)-dependent oxidoreductase [Candidatus Binatia bacterium]|jgi:NAD(P)-dependent dehydrogenase (short-subunit alcohol dehydrogenase family)